MWQIERLRFTTPEWLFYEHIVGDTRGPMAKLAFRTELGALSDSGFWPSVIWVWELRCRFWGVGVFSTSNELTLLVLLMVYLRWQGSDVKVRRAALGLKMSSLPQSPFLICCGR